MMRKLVVILSAVLLILSGCWNQTELIEWGFVMGVALDQGEDGKIILTAQVYRPGGEQTGPGSATTEDPNILVQTIDDSLFEAIRDITLHLGRKAQWSHMRVILIGEEMARNTDIGKLVDFYYRDHEPRHTISVIITKGKAEAILNKQPVIEDTTGHQLRMLKRLAHMYSGKTLDTTLLSLAREMHSEHSDAAIAYVYEDKKAHNDYTVAGLALIKKGKMTEVLPSHLAEGLVMLRDDYTSGIIEIACPGKEEETESLEVLSLKTNMKPKLKDGEVAVKVDSHVKGAIGELRCTGIETREDEKEFVKKMEEQIKKEMKETIDFLQEKKIDILGIGNKVYSMNPRVWKEMKPEWDQKFAEISFDVQVNLKLVTTGTVIGGPTVEAEDE
jgi:spore germination protein KC